jgi:hypothetical protein
VDFDFCEEARVGRWPAEPAGDVRLVFAEDDREAFLCVAAVCCSLPRVPLFAVAEDGVEFVSGCAPESGADFAAAALLAEVLVADVCTRALAEAAVRHITTDAKITA